VKRMGLFQRHQFTTSDSHEKFWIYEPTIIKKSAINIPNKDLGFVKKIRMRQR
jgi:hypothetical protein